MRDPSRSTKSSLRVLHVFRAPVGGLFRHVVDLAGEQISQGHAVGLIVDSETGGEAAERTLAALQPRLELGLHRLPMRRDPHPLDALALVRVTRLAAAARPDILHGHGSKGALYARLAGLLTTRSPVGARVYTPHGGSLHFDPQSFKGRLVLGTERLLANRTDVIVFESTYAAGRFQAAVGSTTGLTRIVHNGLAASEFVPVVAPPEAADFLYVGELRLLKGVDVFLKAMAALPAVSGRRPSAVVVGDGPDRTSFEELASSLGLGLAVRFAGALPVRQALALGQILVVPSRAESLPYVVLEGIAAQKSVLATRVGGIPEIFGPFADRLVSPDDVEALATAMARAVNYPPEQRLEVSVPLCQHVKAKFSVDGMVEGVLAAYRDALAAKERARRAAAPSARSPRIAPASKRLLP